MRKLHILFAALCLVLAGACSSDDILEQTPGTPETPETPETPQAKGERITIRASVDDAMGVKAGVVENNTDYKAGEKFYWSDDDQIKLIFVKLDAIGKEIPESSRDLPTSYFTAENAENEAADFTGNIPAGLTGTYNIYACSHKMAPYDWAASFSSSLRQDQTQTGKSSQGLYADGNMELWGKAVRGVEIVDGKLKGGTPELSFEMAQLNALLRFTITNNIEDKAMTVRKISVTTKKGSDDIYSFFSASATLFYKPEIEWWGSTQYPSWSTISLTVEQEEGEATISNGGVFDAYMCVLPTGGRTLAADASFAVNVFLEGPDGREYVRQGTITNETSGFGFLFDNSENGGLQAGMRYYFDIELNEDNIKYPTYKVGDPYPTKKNPEGIVFWVKPGSKGIHGQVVGLNEAYITKWGVDNDEEKSKVVGIRNSAEGATATKNMIAKYKNSETFESDYPAFYYIYKTVNGGNEDGAWYLPSSREQRRLLAESSGKTYEDISDWPMNNPMPGYNSAECVAARAAFNQKLLDAGGVAIGSNSNTANDVNWVYFSSTETSMYRFYRHSFKICRALSAMKSDGGNIRWIKEF